MTGVHGRGRDYIINQEVRKILEAKEDIPGPFAGHCPQPSPMRHCSLNIPPVLNVTTLGTSVPTQEPLGTIQSQTIVGDYQLSKSVLCFSI